MQPPEPPAPVHPVDRRIVELVREPSEIATPEDIAAIVARMATAPFNRRPMRVRLRDRGQTYGEIILGSIAAPLDIHLVKRVREEQQWIDGTSAYEYQTDLRQSAHYRHARLLVYERTADVCAATISPTAEVVPERRLGPRWLPHLLVVYSARHSVIRTAYMYSDFSELDMPEAVRWLR